MNAVKPASKFCHPPPGGSSRWRARGGSARGAGGGVAASGKRPGGGGEKPPTLSGLAATAHMALGVDAASVCKRDDPRGEGWQNRDAVCTVCIEQGRSG